MYVHTVSPRLFRSDAETEALRGTLPNTRHFEALIDEDALVIETTGMVIARLVTNCLVPKTIAEATSKFSAVHGKPTNRGSVIYRGAMMNRERQTDGTLSLTKAVPVSIIKLLSEQNARLGLTGPFTDFLGYFDKRPRDPFCRETAWSLRQPVILDISRPLVREVEYVNKSELKYYWRRQRDFMRQVSQRFKYEDSMFSTVTVNLNLACCYHTDDGDFRGGMGNLIVLDLPRDDSGILVMPRERVAFIVRPTDVLLMDVHRLHGNLPLTLGGSRLTAVLYARERIDKCS